MSASHWEEKYGDGGSSSGGYGGSASSASNYVGGIPSSIADGSAFEITYTAVDRGM